jgi:MYXO-CTERM domain-containing protein
VVFGDPDFGKAPASEAGLKLARRGAAIARLSEVLFEPLPATREEATMASAMLGGTLLLSGKASETALRGLAGPSVLHLATHGFFLPDPSVSLGLADEAASAILDDPQRTPMLRAGVVLAGFNRHPSKGDDDGLVTALEASSLDLSGTKLVVLSACETGLGDATPGEGIYGLRRALSIAGAETVVMSLWRVPDAATRDLMRGFYTGLGEGLRPSEAMRRAALAMRDESQARKDRGEPLITRYHPYFWASFVVSGDDQPLTGVRIAPAAPLPSSLPKGPRGCACRVGVADDAPSAPPLVLMAALALALARRRRRV